MSSIFSQLPNDLIMKIIKMNTDREIDENRSKYNVIVKQLGSYFCLCEEIDPEGAMAGHLIAPSFIFCSDDY